MIKNYVYANFAWNEDDWYNGNTRAQFILETYCWNAGFWADFPSYVKFK